MISRKHTPGPWDFTPGEVNMRTSSTIFKRGDPEFLIAHVICEGFNAAQREQDLANARLIAHVDDLLRACDEAYRFIDAFAKTNRSADLESLAARAPLILDRVFAAIKQATGDDPR